MAARGEAANTRQQELGSYLPTGDWLQGRPVYSKAEGETRYLSMVEWGVGWAVTDKQVVASLASSGGRAFLASGRGTISPGDPAAGPSVRGGWQGWSYWSDGEWLDSRGQVTVTCD